MKTTEDQVNTTEDQVKRTDGNGEGRVVGVDRLGHAPERCLVNNLGFSNWCFRVLLFGGGAEDTSEESFLSYLTTKVGKTIQDNTMERVCVIFVRVIEVTWDSYR